MNRTIPVLSLVAALAVAGCGGSSSNPSSPSSNPAAVRVTRGAITARSAGLVTVNGIQLTTSTATVRADGKPVAETTLAKGMVVTVRGSFDDRNGDAAEVETEHAIEGQVDDKGVDFVDIDGQRVHVDDSTEFGASHPDGLASISVGAVIAVSGVADDHGGIRAARIDDSPRETGPATGMDDLDLQGFVSNIVAGTSFELRITPDAADHYLVLVSGITLPTGFKDGARVEVHSLTPPAAGAATLLGTITASSVELEDGLEAADDQGEMEIEGIVTSGTAASFVIDGMTVVTDGATVFNLGVAGDLVPGVKVEAEGKLTAGVLHATKVSFRPGARIVAKLTGLTWDGTQGSATLLGVHVQLPSFANYDVTPAEGLLVEVRGNPDAAGTGIVALRVMPFSPSGGNPDRVFVRAVVTAKSNTNAAAPTFTVLGFDVTTSGAAFEDSLHNTLTAAAFFAAVEVGHTVIKVRANSPADVVGTAFAADALELEGND
jgi:Domain of unknown function (DUF5666)